MVRNASSAPKRARKGKGHRSEDEEEEQEASGSHAVNDFLSSNIDSLLNFNKKSKARRPREVVESEEEQFSSPVKRRRKADVQETEKEAEREEGDLESQKSSGNTFDSSHSKEGFISTTGFSVKGLNESSPVHVVAVGAKGKGAKKGKQRADSVKESDDEFEVNDEYIPEIAKAFLVVKESVKSRKSEAVCGSQVIDYKRFVRKDDNCDDLSFSSTAETTLNSTQSDGEYLSMRDFVVPESQDIDPGLDKFLASDSEGSDSDSDFDLSRYQGSGKSKKQKAKSTVRRR